MRGIALLAAIVAPIASAIASEMPQTNLELYRATYMQILHGHPAGIEGKRLDRAERVLGERRAKIRSWLKTCESEPALAAIDDEVVEVVHDIHWIRTPSVQEEWEIIREARRALSLLEKRRQSSSRCDEGS